MKIQLAVVIPSYLDDLAKIPNMLKSISEQTRLPDLVVLRISSLDVAPVYETPFPLTILTTHTRQSTAQNRNAAAITVPVDFDIVSFFDSDDWMHPRRLEFIEKAFMNPVDAVLHNMICKCEEDFDGWSDVSYLFYENCIFLSEGRCHIKIENQTKSSASGHISVRRSLIDNVVFPAAPSTIGYEDTLYIVNLYTLGFRVGFIDAHLSLYMQFSPEVRFEKDYNIDQLRRQLINTHTESIG